MNENRGYKEFKVPENKYKYTKNCAFFIRI